MNERIQNVTANFVCPHCEPGKSGPSGLVAVWTRKDGMTEYGPCPNCEAGYRAEQRRWPNGYWKGKPTHLPTPKPVVSGTPPRDAWVDIPPGKIVELSELENSMRSRLLNARFSGLPVDPAVGIDMGDGQKRRVLLERELAKVPA